MVTQGGVLGRNSFLLFYPPFPPSLYYPPPTTSGGCRSPVNSKTLFIPSLSRKESLGSSVKKNLEWFSGNVNSLSIGMSIMLMLQMKARLKDNWLMKEVDLRFVLKNWKFSLQKYLFQIFWLNISFSEKSWYE